MVLLWLLYWTAWDLPLLIFGLFRLLLINRVAIQFTFGIFRRTKNFKQLVIIGRLSTFRVARLDRRTISSGKLWLLLFSSKCALISHQFFVNLVINEFLEQKLVLLIVEVLAYETNLGLWPWAYFRSITNIRPFLVILYKFVFAIWALIITIAYWSVKSNVDSFEE